MPIRDLTQNEKERLLSQEEVNKLQEGTKVFVKWEGGNGPHDYIISYDKWGDIFAATPHYNSHITNKPLLVSRLNNVGKTKFNTRVLLDLDED